MNDPPGGRLLRPPVRLLARRGRFPPDGPPRPRPTARVRPHASGGTPPAACGTSWTGRRPSDAELADGPDEFAEAADVRPDGGLHFPGRFAFAEGRAAPAAGGGAREADG
ncbi:hypothetical protein ACFPA8_02790 [Streptomyces ovatisporus]|uniref:Uncharacterized protein n=1 Tax=Streptomyces ovatisporus TaxID=1128682 RepID=A0ABV9A1I7_9ACTN